MRTPILFAVLSLCGLGFSQDKYEPIYFKNGSKYVLAKITKTDESGVDVILKINGEKSRIAFDEMESLTAYKIKEKAMNKDSASDHVSLAEFCRKNDLLQYAENEYQKAAELDKKKEDDYKKEVKDIRREAARRKLEKAKGLISEAEKDFNQKKFEEASKILKEIVLKYDDTEYAEDAKKEDDRLADLVKAKMEEKTRKDEEDKKKKSQNDEKQVHEEVAKLQSALEKSVKFAWEKGLDHEAESQFDKAATLWRGAVAEIDADLKAIDDYVAAGKITAEKSKSFRDFGELWLMRFCYALGRLNISLFKFQDGMKYLNRVLKINPDHELANKLKYDVTSNTIRAKGTEK